MTLDLLADDATSGTATLPAAELSELLGRAVPQVATGLWALEEVQPLLTVPRGSQRFTACVVRWHDHTTGTATTAQLVVKEDRKRVPRWADKAARVLQAAGLGDAAHYRVAHPYGVTAPGALVSERAPGLSLAALLHAAPDTTAAALLGQELAGWVLALQGCGAVLPGSDRRGLADAAPQLVQVAAVAGPAAGRELAILVRDLAAIDRAHPAGPLLPCHGDLHPANVFRSDTGLVAIDLDTVAAREPAYDVGYAVAQLVVSSLLGGVPLEVARAAAVSLWDAYVAAGAPADDERVAVQATRAVIQSMHFELVTYATGRPGLRAAWTDLAFSMLHGGRDGLRGLELPDWAPGAVPAAAAG